MSDLYLIGVSVTACSAGLVAAAAYIVAPLVQSWRRARRLALALPVNAEPCEFHPCPNERRTRPHAVHADGSRSCWYCGHNSPGDQ
ncbi:hypothetical protein AB0D45_02810 [Streptomyces sp. NPDC048352]|uniref:hypothetical protein n=1 Tax=Streptomyces sp. NPDC048352 TaxID=3154718 RepID=UPI00342FAD36